MTRLLTTAINIAFSLTKYLDRREVLVTSSSNKYEKLILTMPFEDVVNRKYIKQICTLKEKEKGRKKKTHTKKKEREH